MEELNEKTKATTIAISIAKTKARIVSGILTTKPGSNIFGKESIIIFKIAEKIGKDTMIIKKHPRDNSDFFRDNGFKVAESSTIPWEVI